MPEIATIGFDIAKNVFQLHGVDRSGTIVLRKALRRRPSKRQVYSSIAQRT
jgi:transposase